MHRVLLLTATFGVGIILAAAFGLFNKGPAANKVTITGSSTVAPLIAEIGKRYEQNHPGVRVDVQTGGSSRGIADARSEVADIGMVSRNPKNGEKDLAWHAVAKDGLAIIVHASNPIANLTKQQVIAIYTGEIENWRQLGSAQDSPITIVNKAAGRSTLEVFLKYHGLKEDQIDADVIIGDNQQGIKVVANNPQAIAYVSIGTAEFEAAHGSPIKLLKADGIVASVENVKQGIYPIARTLHIVTGKQAKGAAEDFIRYATSARINDLIKGQYFVPVRQ